MAGQPVPDVAAQMPGADPSAWLHSMLGVAHGARAGVGDVDMGAGGVQEVGLGGRGGVGEQAGFAARVHPSLPTPNPRNPQPHP